MERVRSLVFCVVSECKLQQQTVFESAFSTGFVFWYWPYYEAKRGCSDWFIRSKYESLEDEVLNNKICGLEHHQFLDVHEKALRFIDTDICRASRSCSDHLHYGVERYSGLSLEHLMGVILYCDHSAFCTAFSSTFRRNRAFESNSSMKARNREYWHLSKLLRETVELFGDHKGWHDAAKGEWTGITGPFYCGMSFVCVVPRFCCSLK